MKNFYKVYLLLLFPLFTACEKEDNTTEISGKVIDFDSKTPVQDVEIQLILSDGLTSIPNAHLDKRFLNPEIKTTKTNKAGSYTFIVPTNENRKLFAVTPSKSGYTEDLYYPSIPLTLGSIIKHNDKNTLDLNIAKASYLQLNIKKNSTAHIKNLTVYGLPNKVGFPLGIIFSYRNTININANTVDTTIVREFYFKNTPQVKIDGEIPNQGTISETVNLVEYDTVQYHINY